MKHAGQQALDALEGLLQELRRFGELQERSRGVFYLRSKPFLHFHEDPAGLYADLRIGTDFERLKVDSPAQRNAFVRSVGRQLGHGA
jgi:hypothetical protein